MSDCKFNIPFSKPAALVIVKVKAAIENQNGIFNGDENSGEFEVTVIGNTIKGNYIINGQNLNLNITDKPFFIPCNTIESFLLKQFS